MSQILVNRLSFDYGDFYHSVFNNVSLNIDTDWKTGLIGKNGRGKTTLLKLLLGELIPSQGTIRSSVTMSYFPYVWDNNYTKTLDVIKENVGKLKTLELKMDELIVDDNGNDASLYFDLEEQYKKANGYEMESMIYKEINRMDMDPSMLERDFNTLSGGEQTCMLIISLFLRNDAFILLDEPTNHLDTKNKLMLANYLHQKKGFILVSHDTEFLDKIIDHIISINKNNITLEKGNYTSWENDKKLKDRFELQTRKRLVKEIEQLKDKSKTTRKWSDIGNEQKYHFVSFSRQNGAQAYMRQAKNAERHIVNNLEEKERLLKNLEEEHELSLFQDKVEDECIMKVDDLSFSYENNDRYVFQHIQFNVYQGDRIWLRGRNGAGKSTLLKLLAAECKNENIKLRENLQIAYLTQDSVWTEGNLKERFEENLQSIEDFTELYNKFRELCEVFELPKDYENRPLETLSSGELKKINIARMLVHDNQLLLLDEPLNYMDITFRKQLGNAIIGNIITTIFVEHDQVFGEYIATRVINLF